MIECSREKKVNDVNKYLLDDDPMQRFIVEDYVKLQSGLPREYHARMSDKLETQYG